MMVRDAERPTSSLGDFYRKLGELFGVPLSVANRYGSFKPYATSGARTSRTR